MTYSVTGWCPRTRQVGFAMASFDVWFFPGAVVGSVVTAGVGAVTCQANTLPGFGEKVTARLKAGRPAGDALDDALQEEGNREYFQVCVVDAEGRAAAFTGGSPLEWRGHLSGEHCAAAGNTLAGASVVETMLSVFEREQALELSDRLLTALEAGYGAGGDRRGSRGASLWVAGGDLPGGLYLRAQEHAAPLGELRRLLDVARREMDFTATALRAAEIVLPLVDEEDTLRRLGGLTTLQAVDELRRELARGKAPPEALQLLERIARQLREVRPDMGTVPFSLTVTGLRALLPSWKEALHGPG